VQNKENFLGEMKKAGFQQFFNNTSTGKKQTGKHA